MMNVNRPVYRNSAENPAEITFFMKGFVAPGQGVARNQVILFPGFPKNRPLSGDWVGNSSGFSADPSYEHLELIDPSIAGGPDHQPIFRHSRPFEQVADDLRLIFHQVIPQKFQQLESYPPRHALSRFKNFTRIGEQHKSRSPDPGFPGPIGDFVGKNQ